MLRAIYQSIQWEKLYSLAPEFSRRQVDELFGRLAENLGREGPAQGAPPSEAEGDRQVSRHVRLYCDGAASGNPGPAGIGLVIYAEDGSELQAWGAPIGRATNNVAEYRALIEGLSRALELGVREIDVLSDSQLLIRQLTGQYRVKSRALAELHAQAVALLSRFESWKAEHISRNDNQRADKIAAAQIKKARKKRS